MKIIREDDSKFKDEIIIPKEKSMLTSENIQDGTIQR
jgi:hypothetical protein